MAMDRQVRFRQILRQEADGLRTGRDLTRAAQRGRQPLHQVGDTQLASLIADDGRGLGTINLNAAHFLDRENPQQEATAKIAPCRTKKLLVTESECLRPPAHSDPRGLCCFFLWFGVLHHAELGARGREGYCVAVCMFGDANQVNQEPGPPGV